MWEKHIARHLMAYLSGELPPGKARQVESHLELCEACRAERDQIRAGMDAIQHLPLVEAPDSIWPSVAAEFGRHRPRPAAAAVRRRWALAAAALTVLISSTAYWRLHRSSGVQWGVVRVDGSPSVGAKPLLGAGHVRAGEWIETDAGSQALIHVGEIGSVEVAPNTRVRVVTAQPDEHRLALARGEIHASISAPPKLFFVDTASATAVDLGCEYSLTAAGDGSSLLRVTRGWVSFEWKGIDSMVPAGATCRTRPHAGPGIPYFDDAAEKLKQAADAFGIEKSGNSALNVILSESRIRDTLTLWHLLARVDPSDRERVYDHMAALSPPPAGVTREAVLKLDAAALQRWREDLAWKW